MLSDLMNREKYGKINRFWFDEFGFSSHPGQSPAGLFPAAWKQIVKHVRMASPGTMMLPGPDGCKNRGEGGGGEYPVLNYVPIVPGVNRSCQNASVDGKIYAPFESDMSIENPGGAWFWHKGHVFDNATNLWSKYLATSGRGSTFILNVPPNTSGLIPQGYVASVVVVCSRPPVIYAYLSIEVHRDSNRGANEANEGTSSQHIVVFVFLRRLLRDG